VSAWFALDWQSRLAASVCLAAAASLPGAFARSAIAQAARPAVAQVTCVKCHAGVATSYSHAPMRHALESVGADPVLETHPKLTVQMGAYAYTVQTKDGQSTYTVSDGTDSMTLPVRWIFGQNSQTWVLEKDGNLYESLVSYFPGIGGLRTTPGDEKIAPHTLTEAMGRKLSPWEKLQCFNCHATGATAGVKLTLDKLRPGLDCERCHEGVQQHLSDAAHDNFSTLPTALKTMSAGETANFCGQCHRTWDTVVRNHWKGQSDVRFQPYRLENSRCFAADDARISCLACHDPHQPLNHDAAFYDLKCLACHSAAKVASASTPTKSCPVSKINCVSCHMPKIELPGGHALFTDHLIRVVHTGEAYPY
jgi:hypothetical protein